MSVGWTVAMHDEAAMCHEQEAQAALQSVKAEKQALEECLSATASAQRHTPSSAQPAPVTPQPHRSNNPSSAKLSDGTLFHHELGIRVPCLDLPKGTITASSQKRT